MLEDLMLRCAACVPCDRCHGIVFEPWSEDRTLRVCLGCGHVCAHGPCPECGVERGAVTRGLVPLRP